MQILRLEPRVESDLVEEEHSVKKELSAKEKADKVKEANKLFATKQSISRVMYILLSSLCLDSLGF